MLSVKRNYRGMNSNDRSKLILVRLTFSPACATVKGFKWGGELRNTACTVCPWDGLHNLWISLPVAL